MLIRRPNSPQLCPRCTDIAHLLVDISHTPKLGDAHTKWWNETYGKFSDIRGISPGVCQLCRFLQKAFLRVAGFSPSDTPIRITHRTLAKYNGLEHCACVFEALGFRLTLAPIIPVVETDDGETMQAFAGRVIWPMLNMTLARNWIDRCEKHPECRPDHSSKSFDFPFRLVDILEGRLVDAPPDARYVALSYVWGGVRQVLLNNATRAFLGEVGCLTAGGLKQPEDEYSHLEEELRGKVVPQTIRDAIRLCQFFNERYLWIDSLCILQDDEFQDNNGSWTNADKLAQIPKMDMIFGASLLTVVAACGTDSNGGLPGVSFSSSRTQQMMGYIGDQIFVSIVEDPLTDFWQSRWSNRSWTFQEFLLSKRHLIFLPGQVVFHCSKLSWSEDHCMEHVDDPGVVGEVPIWTQSYDIRFLRLPDTSKWPENVFFPAMFINEHYTQWLRHFLKRQLTVSSDILFAFDGALAAASRNIGSSFYGIPIDYFCECLHWSVGLDTKDAGNGRQPHHGLTRRREGFPSWTWAGWFWNVASYEVFNTNYQGKSPKHWCRVGVWGTRTSSDGDFELFRISSPDVKEWGRLDFFPSPAFEADFRFVEEELPKSLEIVRRSPIPSNCLVIKTFTSFIFVSSQRQGEWTPALKVYSSAEFVPENLIGGIKLPLEWKDKINKRLQIIITGSYFYGPDPRWPDRTDEMDPTIDCLVVENVGDGQLERLTAFFSRFADMKKLEWKPVVAILR